jgi:hypothetical protein
VFLLSKKKDEQSRDSCVLEIAQALKKDNWEVDANLEGWNKPSQIGSQTPDVVAKKPGCLTRICQVATEEMFKENPRDYEDLKNYCANYDFHFYMIKDGKRTQVNPEDIKAESKKEA